MYVCVCVLYGKCCNIAILSSFFCPADNKQVAQLLRHARGIDRYTANSIYALSYSRDVNLSSVLHIYSVRASERESATNALIYFAPLATREPASYNKLVIPTAE